jgi:hypothetical protein
MDYIFGDQLGWFLRIFLVEGCFYSAKNGQMWWFICGGLYERNFLNLEVIVGKCFLGLVDVLAGV